jgi:RHS repeat-associated protein
MVVALIAFCAPQISLGQSCRWQGGLGLGATCDEQDCDYQGGKAQCKRPDPVPLNDVSEIFGDKNGFRYDMCGGSGTVASEGIWCTAAGGTWGGPTSCTNLPGPFGNPTLTNDEGTAYATSDNFVHLYIPTCSQSASNTAWGTDYNDGANCTTHGPASYQKAHGGDILLGAGLLRNYQYTYGSQCSQSGAGAIVITKARSVKCQNGYFSRTNSNGEMECVLQTACGASYGNPICAANGVKRQAEIDFRSGAIGGLEFTRFFSSANYPGNAASTDAGRSYSDHWRHSYDRRIVVADPNSYTIASAQRPDGAVESFDTNGHAIQNLDGAADTLVQQTSGGQTTGWQLTLADYSVEQYDASGKLQSIRTREGLTTTLTYNASGQLTTVTDQFGHSLTLTYNAQGNLYTMTDPAGGVYTYGYDSTGHLISVLYPGPGNRTKTYVYEDAANPDLVTGIVDENGQRFATYAYDAYGRGISTQHAGGADAYSFIFNTSSTTLTDPLGTGRTLTFADANGVMKTGTITQPAVTIGTVTSTSTYDANGNPASRIDFNGNQTTYVYDLTRNLQTSRTEGLTSSGGTTSATRTITTQWHATYRLPTQITEPSGVAGVNRVTTMSYDASGNLLTRTVTAGSASRTWTYTYDSYGRLLTVDGPRTDVGDVTTYAYYADNDPCSGCRGQLHAITDAASHVTTYSQYDNDSRVTQITDPNGVVSAMTYDPRGWLLTRTEAYGTAQAETTTFTYDNVGQVTRITRPDQSYLSYTYDAAHRLTQVADTAGDSIQYTLDAMGNRTQEQVSDPQSTLRRSQKRIFDSLNHLTSEMGAYQESTQYGYDNNGNRVVSIDPAGAATVSSFDPLNRLLSMLDPAGGTTSYTYDAADHPTSVQDATGLSTTYTFNGLGDQTALVSPDTGATGYAVDSAGNRSAQTDARGVATAYTYDVLNRLTQSVAGSGGTAVTTSYTYDQGTNGIGRLSTVSGGGSTITYGYDAQGRVTQKTEAIGSQSLAVSYAYTSGQLSSITYPSGAVVTYSYDTAGRISALSINGQSLLSGVTYQPFGDIDQFTFAGNAAVNRTHDMEGRVLQVSLGPDAAIPDSAARTYNYDALNRLTGATLGPSSSLVYGYDAIGDRVNQVVNGVSSTFTYPSNAHQLASISGGMSNSYGYDAAGHQTTRGLTTLTYDTRGRLTGVSGGASATYMINGRGERVQKIVGSTTTRFIYNESGRLIGEYDGNGGTIQEYVYLDDLPVAIIRGSNMYPVYSDQLGAPRAVVDTAHSVDVWRWEVTGSAFGEHPDNQDPHASGQPFVMNLRFPGQYYDAETGLNYNYRREYDPTTGRYVQSDPIGLGGGLNTYSYVRSDPLDEFDLLGLIGSYKDCGTRQKKAIQDAIDLVKAQWKACFGKDCLEPSSTITDTSRIDGFIDMALASMDIKCSKTSFKPGTDEPACAYTRGSFHIVGPPYLRTTITPLGFGESTISNGQCECLSSTMFHEILHFADTLSGQRLSDYNHHTIDPIVNHCAQCPIVVTP